MRILFGLIFPLLVAATIGGVSEAIAARRSSGGGAPHASRARSQASRRKLDCVRPTLLGDSAHPDGRLLGVAGRSDERVRRSWMSLGRAWSLERASVRQAVLLMLFLD